MKKRKQWKIDQEAYLKKSFWTPYRKLFSKEERTKLLVQFDGYIGHTRGHFAIKRLRWQFDKKKTRLYPIEDRACMCCEINTANIRHHIIEIQNGGLNQKINLILLCYACHKEIHPWLEEPPVFA